MCWWCMGIFDKQLHIARDNSFDYLLHSFPKVMRAAAAPPVPHYSFFLGSLLLTVRLNICECVLASYRDLTPQAAMGILMFSSLEETVEFFADNFPDLQVSC